MYVAKVGNKRRTDSSFHGKIGLMEQKHVISGLYSNFITNYLDLYMVEISKAKKRLGISLKHLHPGSCLHLVQSDRDHRLLVLPFGFVLPQFQGKSHLP